MENTAHIYQKDSNIQKKVYADRLKLLHKNLFYAIPTNTLASTLVLISLYSSSHSTLIWWWYSGTLLHAVLRFIELYYYYRNPENKSNFFLFIISTLFSALLWGFAGAVLIPKHDLLVQMIVIASCLGMVSGGIQTLEASLTSAFIWVVGILLPLNIWLYFQAQILTYFILAIAVTIFIIFMLITAWRGHKLLIQAFTLNYYNEELFEKELSSRKLLQEAQSIAHLGSWTLDLATNKVNCSDELLKMLNIKETAPFTRKINLIHPADREKYEKIFAQALQNKTSYDTDVRLIIENDTRWFNIIGKPVLDPSSRSIIKFQGTSMDVTARKSDELRRKIEHESLQALMQPKVTSPFKTILKIISEAFTMEMGHFYQWNDQQQGFKYEENWTRNQSILETYKKCNIENDKLTTTHILVQKILKTLRPLSLDVAEMKDLNNYNDMCNQLGIKKIIVFPVIIDKEPNSILIFFSTEENKLRKEDLRSINSICSQLGLYIKQKQSQIREQELNQRLIVSARQAGMSDVATNILHNVGNILNSVNVSINHTKEKLNRSKLLSDFTQINRLLEQHNHDLNQYLAENSNDKKFIRYLSLLEKGFQDERAFISEELKSVLVNVEHIREVTMMQQGLNNVLGMVESVNISEQIDAAIKMIGFNFYYDVERDYNIDQFVLLDKSKFLQIIINLIRNAKDALSESQNKDKKINLITSLSSNNSLQIQISDNGIGILPENLKKMFTFGFTTKKKGHGIGLHSCILLAKEMGGKLNVTSEGLNKGTTFTLQLPYNLPQ